MATINFTKKKGKTKNTKKISKILATKKKRKKTKKATKKKANIWIDREFFKKRIFLEKISIFVKMSHALLIKSI